MSLALLGAESVGIDWLQAGKGVANALSNAGSLMSGKGVVGPDAAAVAAEMERRRIEEERRRQAESAQMKKIGIGVGVAVVGALGIGLAMRRR